MYVYVLGVKQCTCLVRPTAGSWEIAPQVMHANGVILKRLMSVSPMVSCWVHYGNTCVTVIVLSHPSTLGKRSQPKS